MFRVPIFIVLLISLLQCTFAYNDSALAENAETLVLQDELDKFEKEGFGIDSVTSDRAAVSTSKKTTGLISSLNEESRDRALVFLSFPARGIWSGPEVDQAYEKFMQNLSGHDKDSACFHFIQGAYAFGKKDYFYALGQINTASGEDPGCVAIVELRALIADKNGDMVAAKKNWQYAHQLLRTTTGSPTTATWVNGVVNKMKEHWHELIRAQGKGNPGHSTIIIVASIDQNGQVTEARITQSSGNQDFDRLAENACLNCSPVEPPPPGLELPVKIQLNFDKIKI